MASRQRRSHRQAPPDLAQRCSCTTCLPDQLRPRLEQLLSRPLAANSDSSGQWQSFLIEAAPGASVTISVNPATGELRLAGPAARTTAWRTVIEAIDSGPTPTGAVTKLVSTTPASQDRVRQVLQVVQSQATEQPRQSGGLISMLLKPDASRRRLTGAGPASGCTSSRGSGNATANSRSTAIAQRPVGPNRDRPGQRCRRIARPCAN